MTGKKTGGRAAGTPNRVTSELRKTLKEIIAGELEQMPEMLKDMPARERFDLVIKLLPFCMPKVNTIAGTYDRDWASMSDE
jgi:hypothetical protein